jgi:hypothetical protein
MMFQGSDVNLQAPPVVAHSGAKTYTNYPTRMAEHEPEKSQVEFDHIAIYYIQPDSERCSIGS